MKCWIYRDKECIAKGLGLLAVRVVVGYAFVLHGWGKISGEAGAGAWKGDTLPAAMQMLAAYSEFLGGIALILGLLTPLAAIMVGGTMVGAIWIAHWNDPFVNPGGPSKELAAVYLAIMFALLLIGPGRFSVDWLLCGRWGSVFDKSEAED